MKLKKGDEVVVMTGKDKGKKGKIEKVIRSENKILLPGINVFKRHMKKRDEQHPGGIIKFSRPLPSSNVALLCPKCGKVTRIGYVIEKDTKKRICRKCKSAI